MRPRRIDRDQPVIVEALEDHGAEVLSLARYGMSVDLLVYHNDHLFLLEVKNHDDPPSKRKLTDDELKLARRFPIAVVWTVEMALRAIGVGR